MRRIGALAAVALSVAALLPASTPALATCTSCKADGHPDYNGDNRADLTIGSWGAFWILPGSASGPDAVHAQEWDADDPGVPGSEGSGLLGDTLAWGDFDHDGYDDLVAMHVDTGKLLVFRGSSSGLTSAGLKVLSLATPGVPGSTPAGYGFGSGFQVGDFDGDGYADLVVLWFRTSDQAPRLDVLFGGSNGLTGTGAQLFRSEQSDMPGHRPVSYEWGDAMAVGDFNHDGRDDLAIGCPFATTGTAETGGVIVLYGKQGVGLTTTHGRYLVPGTNGVLGSAANGVRFGMSLATGDFDANGADDLAVWGPNQKLSGARRDAVHVLYGTVRTPSAFGGISATGDQIFSELTPGMTHMVNEEDMGMSLAAGDINLDGADELAIGVPYGTSTVQESVDGGVHLLYGFPGAGLVLLGNELITLATPGVPGSPGDGDHAGFAITFSDTMADRRLDLAFSLPTRNFNPDWNVGMVAWLPATKAADGLTGTGSMLWKPADVNGVGPRTHDVWFGRTLQ